ncbi:hypothetical protein GCM10009808_06970 [Microbacterium sediminicola]|uniref:DUF4190 domain-containing protein n=1 Tax=Microbacterium sediminicola TaxID=415210 RepID=A0ABN2HRR9_9MICO
MGLVTESRVGSQPPATSADPHRAIGIVGFVLSFVAVLNLVGLVLCIVGLVKSRRAGFLNRFALAGVIVAAVGLVFMAVVIAFTLPPILEATMICARLGDGVHLVGDKTYGCFQGGVTVSTPAN